MPYPKCLAGVLALTIHLAIVSDGSGQQLRTLYNFGQPPNNPYGGVVPGPDHNLYGTTYMGGKLRNVVALQPEPISFGTNNKHYAYFLSRWNTLWRFQVAPTDWRERKEPLG